MQQRLTATQNIAPYDTLNPIQRIFKMSVDARQIFYSTIAARSFFTKKYNIRVKPIKCMDGRKDLKRGINCPPYWLEPIRTLGGKCNIGWPALKPRFEWSVLNAGEQGQTLCIPVTFHFYDDTIVSEELNCKGYKGSVPSAIQGQAHVRDQINDVTGGLYLEGGIRQVHSILVGIKSDIHELFLFSESGKVFRTSQIVDMSAEEARHEVSTVLSNDHPEIIDTSRVKLKEFWIDSIMENRSLLIHQNGTILTPEELRHQEWIVAGGNRFDYIDWGDAIKIKSWAPGFLDAIVAGIGISQESLQRKLRLEKRPLKSFDWEREGQVLLINDGFDGEEHSFDYKMAVQSVLWTYEQTVERIHADRQLAKQCRRFMQPLVGVVGTDRFLHEVEVNKNWWKTM